MLVGRPSQMALHVWDLAEIFAFLYFNAQNRAISSKTCFLVAEVWEHAIRLWGHLIDENVKISVSQMVHELQLGDQAEPATTKNNSKKSKAKQGEPLVFDDPEPSTLPQDGAMLLENLVRQIRRLLVVDIESAYAIALWIVFAYLTPHAFFCPNLCFTSEAKACDKTTALDLVSHLVPRPLMMANILSSALFLNIDAYALTMIINEANTLFYNNEVLRTIINGRRI